MTDERRNEYVAAPSGVPEVPPAPGEPDGHWAKERPPEDEPAEAAEDVTPTPEAEDRARPI